MKLKIDKNSCLLPASIQTGIMIVFVLWYLIPESFLASISFPNYVALMPTVLIVTLGIFIWNMALWLRGIIRSKGKDSSQFWIAFPVILADIVIMGSLMPGMGK